MTPAEIERVFDWYSADLSQNVNFQREIHRWSTLRQDLKTNHPPYAGERYVKILRQTILPMLEYVTSRS